MVDGKSHPVKSDRVGRPHVALVWTQFIALVWTQFIAVSENIRAEID